MWRAPLRARHIAPGSCPGCRSSVRVLCGPVGPGPPFDLLVRHRLRRFQRLGDSVCPRVAVRLVAEVVLGQQCPAGHLRTERSVLPSLFRSSGPRNTRWSRGATTGCRSTHAPRCLSDAPMDSAMPQVDPCLLAYATTTLIRVSIPPGHPSWWRLDSVDGPLVRGPCAQALNEIIARSLATRRSFNGGGFVPSAGGGSRPARMVFAQMRVSQWS